jgi:hypothetical protein
MPATGDYHRSAGEASKLSLLHEWSLPLSSGSKLQSTHDPPDCRM